MIRSISAYLGIATVGLFVVAFAIFSFLAPEFDPFNDYVSKLGARGQLYATWWNLIGFVAVGLMFSAFGWTFGQALNDSVVGICLTGSGMAFVLGAIPTDLANSETILSKFHFVSICFALAGWCMALARMTHSGLADKRISFSAYFAAVFSVIPMLGIAANLCSAPIAHRLTLFVVFSWIIFVSTRLLWENEPPNNCAQ